MLHQLSWTSYFEIVIFFTAVYYIFVLFRYYREDARQMLRSREAGGDTQKVPAVLRYEEVESGNEAQYEQSETQPNELLERLQKEDFATAEKFIGQLKDCIENASGKPLAPAVLIPQIKKLFRENPELAHSPERPSINELIVQECESKGTALLNVKEVDQWWPD